MGCRLEKKTSFTHRWQLPTEIWGIYKKPARLQVNLLRSHTKRSSRKNKVYFYILAPTAWNKIISPRSLRPLSPWVNPWKNSQDSAWVVLMSGIDLRGIMRRSHWIIRAKTQVGSEGVHTRLMWALFLLRGVTESTGCLQQWICSNMGDASA